MKKAIGLTLAVLIAIVAGVLGYLVMRKPAMAAPVNIKVEMTPERIARGKYLFEIGADCIGCHSERDWTKFSSPVVAAARGKGMIFPLELGLPGKVVAPNITPDFETGIGSWSDGEKIRAIREGVAADGHALFPMMPYTLFRSMSDEDVQALVAYLNTLPPLRNPLPRTELDFPVKYLIKSVPQPVQGRVPQPDKTNPLRHGEYLVTICGCVDCHSQMEKGDLRQDLLYAGGREFRIGKFVVNSANITPDAETGIGSWSEDRFLNQFRNYRRFAEGTELPQSTQANFTIMLWPLQAQRPDDELRAIFTYLKTLKPIHNPVNKHPEAPPS